MPTDRRRRKIPVHAMYSLLTIAFLWSVTASAGTWRDQFNDDRGGTLGSWVARGELAVWTVADGFLHANELPLPAEMLMTAEFVELTESSGSHSRLQIGLAGLENLALGLGRVFPGDGTYVSYYLLGGGGVSAYRIGTKGTSWDLRFGDWVPKNPGTIWRDPPPRRVEVVFDNGHFQTFADGEPRVEFTDPQFKDVEFIIILAFNSGDNEHGQLDAFEISGPTIQDAFAVSSVGKLSTRWAMLKRRL